MRVRNRTVTVILAISTFIVCLTSAVYSQAFAKQKIPNAVLHAKILFDNAGNAKLEVKSLDRKTNEAEEMARLLAHWYAKGLYILNTPMPRAFLTYQVNAALGIVALEGNQKLTPLKPKQNILKKVGIADQVRLSDSVIPNQQYIDLYLVKGPKNQRGLVSFLGQRGTEQQTCFSWAILLNYAAQKYNAKELRLITAIMNNLVSVYSGGADLDSINNMMTLPNTAFFKAKKSMKR